MAFVLAVVAAGCIRSADPSLPAFWTYTQHESYNPVLPDTLAGNVDEFVGALVCKTAALEEDNLRMRQERTLLYLALSCGLLLLISVWRISYKRKRQVKSGLSQIARLQEEVRSFRQDLLRRTASDRHSRKALEDHIIDIRELIELSYRYECKPELFIKEFRQKVKTGKTDSAPLMTNGLRLFVDENYDDLISRISEKYPMLKDDDLLIICLLRCGFSYVEISVCMGYENVGYVNTKKQRIAKKMGLSVSLENFIENYPSCDE